MRFMGEIPTQKNAAQADSLNQILLVRAYFQSLTFILTDVVLTNINLKSVSYMSFS